MQFRHCVKCETIDRLKEICEYEYSSYTSILALVLAESRGLVSTLCLNTIVHIIAQAGKSCNTC